MSDSLKDLSPINIGFSIGEQPSASKMTNALSQATAGLQFISFAIGDIHNDQARLEGYFWSGKFLPDGTTWEADATSGTKLGRRLDIINLARILGPASSLNPQLLDTIGFDNATGLASPVTFSDILIIEDDAEVADADKRSHTARLRYIPDGGTVTETTATSTFVTAKTSLEDLTDPGDYYIDTDKRLAHTYNTMSQEITLEYDVNIRADQDHDTYSGARHNVIPDPVYASTGTQKHCKITNVSGAEADIELPILVANQEGLIDSLDVTAGEQLELPQILTEKNFSIGDPIPDGFIQLYHKEQGIISGITFSYLSQTAVHASGAILPDGDESTYFLITGGTTVTQTIDEMRRRFRRHQHDGTKGDQQVRHKDLLGSVGIYGDGAGAGPSGHTTHGASATYEFSPSWIRGNDHPQYLLRDGYAAARDPKNASNAMIGELLIGSTVEGAATDSWVNESADTFGLQFGSTAGPRLYRPETDFYGPDVGIEHTTGILNLTTDFRTQSGGVHFGAITTTAGGAVRGTVGIFSRDTDVEDLAGETDRIRGDGTDSTTTPILRVSGSDSLLGIAALHKNSTTPKEMRIFRFHGDPLGTGADEGNTRIYGGEFVARRALRSVEGVVGFGEEPLKSHIQFEQGSDSYSFYADDTIDNSFINMGTLTTRGDIFCRGDVRTGSLSADATLRFGSTGDPRILWDDTNSYFVFYDSAFGLAELQVGGLDLNAGSISVVDSLNMSTLFGSAASINNVKDINMVAPATIDGLSTLTLANDGNIQALATSVDDGHITGEILDANGPMFINVSAANCAIFEGGDATGQEVQPSSTIKIDKVSPITDAGNFRPYVEVAGGGTWFILPPGSWPIVCPKIQSIVFRVHGGTVTDVTAYAFNSIGKNTGNVGDTLFQLGTASGSFTVAGGPNHSITASSAEAERFRATIANGNPAGVGKDHYQIAIFVEGGEISGFSIKFENP